MNIKKIIAVLGAGNMGTALAQVLADNGHIVHIWNWEGEKLPLQQIEKYHENKKFLPKVKLSKNILSKYKIDEALSGAEVVFFVLPSGVMEHTISFAARSIENNAVLVDVSKGLDPHHLDLIPDIMAKHVRPALKKNIVSISGPAIAKQMVSKHYTAMNIASKNIKAIKKVVQVLQNDYIRLIPSSDVIGVEVGGSFKNVYSIAMGMCDALGYGLNTKSALLVNAIGEIAVLIKAMGGKKETAYELAGLGDLIGTSLCEDSRNRRYGECLAKGMCRNYVKEKIGQTVEGIEAIHCLMRLKDKYKIHLPFAEAIYDAMVGRRKPVDVLTDYLRSI